MEKTLGRLQCLIGDAAAEGAPPASHGREYAPAMAGGQATEPLPRVVGLLGADIHITPVEGERRMAIGVVLWPFPHWLFVVLAH